MRMTRDEYYLTVLEAVRQRSTCDRGRSGAIIIKNNRIVTTGYVGAPTGAPHCDEVGHLFQRVASEKSERGWENHCIRTVHAELNAILQAASFGISIRWAQMYCTMTPCFECAKAIVNVGIVNVITVYSYQSQERTVALFKERGILLYIKNPGKVLY